MNKESIGLVVSLGLLFMGYFAVNSYYSNKNIPPPVSITATPGIIAPSAVPTASAVMPTAPAEITKVEPVPPALLELKTPELIVQFTQTGGCIAYAKALAFKESVKSAMPAPLFSSHSLCKAYGMRLGKADLRQVAAQAKRLNDQTVEFTIDVGAVQLKRTFAFEPTGYAAKLTVEVRNISALPLTETIGIELGSRSDAKGSGGMFGDVSLRGNFVGWLNDGSVKNVLLTYSDSPSKKALAEGVNLKPNWVATGSMYFVTALMPKTSIPLNVTAEETGSLIALDKDTPPDQDVVETWVDQTINVAPGASYSSEYDIYMGPKQKALLDKFATQELPKTINYGFFSVVAWPLFYALSFIEKLVGNWGIAIIILTAFVKILLYPLAQKSYVSMKKMQKVQPEIKALQEKYKDDKQQLNKETMALMAQKGANPLSGCLPLLPQLPIFFGLYSVFQQTFELRQAPFYFWIHDLSVKDPYYVLPGIIAVLYFLQQRLTPMSPTMDPMQQKMMQYLPLVFAVMMITFPSGLGIYFCTNTVLSIAQQAYMMRKYKNT